MSYIYRDLSPAEKEVNNVMVTEEIEHYRNFLPFGVTKKTDLRLIIENNFEKIVYLFFLSMFTSLIVLLVLHINIWLVNSPIYTPVPVGRVAIFALVFSLLGIIAIVSYNYFNSVWFRMGISQSDRSEENINRIMQLFSVFYVNDYYSGLNDYPKVASILKGNKSNTTLNKLFLDAIKSCADAYDKEVHSKKLTQRVSEGFDALASVMASAKNDTETSEKVRKELLLKALSNMK